LVLNSIKFGLISKNINVS